MKISAYAKLNLCLDIVGVREDGYHLLDMVMQEIDLADDIEINKADGIFVRCDIPLPKRNTAYVAAEKFFEYTGIKGGADINIRKSVPNRAGLGGGSSDAAAVICALDSIYNTGLTEEKLEYIASLVGSDVPFFIKGGAQRVSGVGEKLKKIENNMECLYVLAKPESGVSTQEAYKKYHETENEPLDVKSVIKALENGDISSFSSSSGNALEKAAYLLSDDIKAVKSKFSDADFCMMTGSGSCVFGLYKNKNAAQAAFERISKDPVVDFCRLCQSINR